MNHKVHINFLLVYKIHNIKNGTKMKKISIYQHLQKLGEYFFKELLNTILRRIL